jgi:hypothetical protein
MPINSHDLELPGMERPWFYQNINNQLREVQKQQEGGTNRHLIQVVFFQNILTYPNLLHRFFQSV